MRLRSITEYDVDEYVLDGILRDGHESYPQGYVEWFELLDDEDDILFSTREET